VADVDPTLDSHLGHKHEACLPQSDLLSQFDCRSEDDRLSCELDGYQGNHAIVPRNV
jgi:hypothetical protein